MFFRTDFQRFTYTFTTFQETWETEQVSETSYGIYYFVIENNETFYLFTFLCYFLPYGFYFKLHNYIFVSLNIVLIKKALISIINNLSSHSHYFFELYLNISVFLFLVSALFLLHLFIKQQNILYSLLPILSRYLVLINKKIKNCIHFIFEDFIVTIDFIILYYIHNSYYKINGVTLIAVQIFCMFSDFSFVLYKYHDINTIKSYP